MRVSVVRALGLAGLLVACGDDGARGDAASMSGSITDGLTEGTEGSTGTGDSGEEGGQKFDAPMIPDPDGCEGEGEGEYEFSVIWIANSPEGTVSKIDTTTQTEVARYITGAGTPDPSRTSVNLHGDVAVLNRGGSVTKIATREEECIDANNDNVIQTSQAPDDVLPWGEDECVVWHQPIPFDIAHGAAAGPRAVAWEPGDPDKACLVPRVWIGWFDIPTDTVFIRRLLGTTGETDAEATVPNWGDMNAVGIYGGAADAEGDFWGIGKFNGALVHVDAQTLQVTRYDNPTGEPFYGIALDVAGDPWIVGRSPADIVWHFNRLNELFENKGATGHVHLRGVAVANDPCGISKYDTVADVMVQAHIDLAGCVDPVGVSIDVDDFVWVVDRGASLAYKVDPVTHQAQTVSGLVSPYTYSDMTGAGLNLVVHPPG